MSPTEKMMIFPGKYILKFLLSCYYIAVPYVERSIKTNKAYSRLFTFVFGTSKYVFFRKILLFFLASNKKNSWVVN